MKVTKEKVENSQAYLKVEVDAAEVEEATAKAFKKMVKQVAIPGFRKGKAPRSLVEQYYGKEALLEEALRELLPETYQKAVQEQELQPIADPKIDVETLDPLVYTAVVPLPPVVKLGDYRSIRIEPETVNITDDDVDATIEHMRHQQATWEPVERPLAYNDLATMDIDGSLDDSPVINRKMMQYYVEKEATYPAPDFADKVVEMKIGETREFPVTYPEDFQEENLKGKEIQFKVTLSEIKEEKLPEVNDEFAKAVSPNFTTMAELREKLTEDLKVRAQQQADQAFENKVVEAAAEQAEVEYPEVLLENELDRMVKEQLSRWGIPEDKMEQFFANIDKTRESFREELKPMAASRVKNSLVLGEVCRDAKLEITKEEIASQIVKMVDEVPNNKEQVRSYMNTPQSQAAVGEMLLTQKTIDLVKKIAKGEAETEEQPAEAEEEVKPVESVAAEEPAVVAETEPAVETQEEKNSETETTEKEE